MKAGADTSVPPKRPRMDRPWNGSGMVHIFEKFDRFFVLDTGSGVVSELDAVAWKIVSELATGAPPSTITHRLSTESEPDVIDRAVVERAMGELTELFEAGELFSEDPLYGIDNRSDAPVSCLCLIVSEDCNLRCDYCFANGGSYSGTRRLMTRDVARASIDFLFERSERAKDVSISYFGGEPLLNLRVIRETTEYALDKARKAGKGVTFNITTNSTILDEAARDFLAERPEITLILSLDGGPEIHDRHRKYADGRGSHSTVLKNITALLADERIDRKRYSVRGTFSGVNHAFSRAAAELLAIGIKDFSIEPAITRGSELEITGEMLEEIKREYDRLALFYLKKTREAEHLSIFHLQAAVDRITFAEPMSIPCGAGAGYLTVAADGALYPCHRFVGDEKFIMGDVWRGKTDRRLSDLFGRIDVNGKDKCRSCWAKYHCGGGCHRHAADFNGDIHEPYEIECELIKHRIELGAYICAEMNAGDMERAREAATHASSRPEFKDAASG